MGKQILFVCSFGQNRSRTGAELWQSYHPEDKVYYTGILAGEDLDSLIDWADHIYVMEEEHKQELLKHRPEAEEKITVLDVVNIFGFGDESLTEQLKRKLTLD
jgi:predicted protein tyrosine phosphatase